jgi:diacylglycerol kinase family enzyme
VATLAAGAVRNVDVGRVETPSASDRARDVWEPRHFLNVVGFGFDIAVIEDSWTVKYLGGDLLYLYCALRQLHRFPGFPVALSANGLPSDRKQMLMLVIANARIFGGGFKIAPEADLADGRLDAVSFANMPLRRRLPLMGRLLRGTHREAPEVTTARAPRFELSFEAPPAYETDGEWRRAATPNLTVEAVPGALRVLVPGAA